MTTPKKPSEDELNCAKMAVTSVSLAFNVADKDVMGTTRIENIAIARQAAYWILREAGMSWTMIAKTMKRKCHGTAMHGAQHIESVLELGFNCKTAERIIVAFNHYKKFYGRYIELKVKRKSKELENAF